ncbi:glycosyl transferases group 1 family protein [Lyngbya aestuarii BL J]|uniref:Glycosyl transferases group 1 family protein n=1 Tax=Lyngbya aestuarii BL J TaxID=1348334 RepID=U7QPF1_9CYAN|nr:hormogonium polysaccharide biosynthesis glycosyltransferase HpsP [Lyngbya aestuarii]ERT08970.1 glycosyl transferases group 1 family protein [Lyngbya aestuarii BL J]
MRILQIIPSIALVYGGPSQMVRGLSAALATQGVSVTILTTDSNGDTGQPPLEVPLNQPVSEDGYTVRYFRCSPFRRYKFSLSLLNWLWYHAHEFDVAHIHALFSPVCSGAATVARMRQLPYILRPLGTLDPADLQKKKQLKQIYATLLERSNIAGASALHFTSEPEAKISERFGVTTRDLVIPLGVNPPVHREEKTEPNHRPVILFMSRIEPKKGLNLLIPALEGVLAAGHQFQFILAGSNPQDPAYESQIQTQIQQSAIADYTTITGFVTGEQKARLLQTADLFVLPSYYENFGIAVAEAMVAGIPVMISDGVQIWEQIKRAEAGWVSTGGVDEITALITSALQNRQERERRGQNARKLATEHYSWDAIATTTIQAYQQILDQKKVD